jgi:hypothetical protein
MRTHFTRGTWWWKNLLRTLDKRDDLSVLTTPMDGPGAAKRSACNIHPSYWSEKDRLLLTRNRGRWGQEATDSANPSSTIAFGTFCQTLLSERTALTVSLISEVDGALSESIFLPHFAQPQIRSRWTAKFPILL